ncbi:hypothetical protein AB0J25_30635 [Streptomyces sp. NPDC049910]|uniref:hypothetical protein n=1 Tax=Streptomyces sp. NPDC049910 TaxID=3155278 RepID=UPI00341637A1
MPATLTVVESGPVSVRDLSTMERTVALYASDMPTSYRYRLADDAKLCDWIVQGAARLGLEELYRSAACTSGYMRLWVEDEAKPGHTAAHVARFPVEKRFHLAQRMASMVSLGPDPEISDAAQERADRPVIETARPEVVVAA